MTKSFEEEIEYEAREVLGHIEIMYPDVWKAMSKSCRFSVRNTIINTLSKFGDPAPVKAELVPLEEDELSLFLDEWRQIFKEWMPADGVDRLINLPCKTLSKAICAKFGNPAPIAPAVARKSLDCLTHMREALELIANNKGLTLIGCRAIANEALKEESEK